MTFQDAEQTYRDFKTQHASGKLSDADFEAQVGKLRLQDSQGRWWQIGVQTGKWYVHDGRKWNEAKLPIEPPMVSSLPQVPAPEETRQGCKKAFFIWLLSAVGIIFLLLGPLLFYRLTTTRTMTAKEAEQIYKDLQSRNRDGKLSDREFEFQVSNLKLQDSQGHWWTIGVQNGDWYMQDGQKWNKATPPAEPLNISSSYYFPATSTPTVIITATPAPVTATPRPTQIPATIVVPPQVATGSSGASSSAIPPELIIGIFAIGGFGLLVAALSANLPKIRSIVMQPPQGKQLKVFLCHASQDKPAVRELYQRLKSAGMDPWLDAEKLLPGENWELEIKKAVRSADAVVVCISRKSANKEGFLQKEIRFALDIADEKPEGTIFIIPLKLEECDAPDRLRQWQWLNYFEPKAIDRLMAALNKRAGSLSNQS